MICEQLTFIGINSITKQKCLKMHLTICEFNFSFITEKYNSLFGTLIPIYWVNCYNASAFITLSLSSENNDIKIKTKNVFDIFYTFTWFPVRCFRSRKWFFLRPNKFVPNIFNFIFFFGFCFTFKASYWYDVSP